MRRLTFALAGLVILVGLWLWLGGGAAQVARWAAEGQRDTQDALARALRALQGGHPGATATLLGLCFAYGFFHAAGPGHGKFVIGGFGLAQRVALPRLMALALASSLAQALTAIVLVGGALALVGWGRTQVQGAADRWLALVSAVMVAGLGLWLVWRGLHALWAMRAPPVDLTPGLPDMGLGSLGHTIGDDGICATCGHAHGPTPAQMADVRGWRDGLWLIAGIAARPCTGALFLLILTWQVGLFWAGILGAVTMALGTACITMLVAGASVSLRESALMRAGTGPGVARLMAGAQVLGGGLIALLAITMAGIAA
jgi:ABC-type nickel/cobalt efflux system permease component RcnA